MRLSETEQLEAMLAENLQRKELNQLEAARGCQQLIDRGLATDEIASKLWVTAATLMKYLQVLELPKELQQLVAEFELMLSSVQYLVKLPTVEQQLTIGRQAAKESWVAWEVKRAVDTALGKKPPLAPPPRPMSTADHEARSKAMARAAASKGDERTHLLGMLCDVTAMLRRKPELVHDLAVRDWLESLAGVVRDAQKRKVA